MGVARDLNRERRIKMPPTQRRSLSVDGSEVTQSILVGHVPRGQIRVQQFGTAFRKSKAGGAEAIPEPYSPKARISRRPVPLPCITDYLSLGFLQPCLPFQGMDKQPHRFGDRTRVGLPLPFQCICEILGRGGGSCTPPLSPETRSPATQLPVPVRSNGTRVRSQSRKPSMASVLRPAGVAPRRIDTPGHGLDSGVLVHPPRGFLCPVAHPRPLPHRDSLE